MAAISTCGSEPKNALGKKGASMYGFLSGHDRRGVHGEDRGVTIPRSSRRKWPWKRFVARRRWRRSPHTTRCIRTRSRRGRRSCWSTRRRSSAVKRSPRRQGADPGAAHEDRRAHRGERFFRRRAREVPRPERQAMIDRGAQVAVKRQAELLDLSRSSVYYTPRPLSERDLRLMRRIDELHLQLPYYGSRKLAAALRREGHEVGRRHVATLMWRMGIEALYRRPRTSIPARGASIYPYLLSGLAIERPNQVWASDMTFTCRWPTASCTWWRSWMSRAARC